MGMDGWGVGGVLLHGRTLTWCVDSDKPRQFHIAVKWATGVAVGAGEGTAVGVAV